MSTEAKIKHLDPQRVVRALDELHREIEHLRAENKRLREALKQLMKDVRQDDQTSKGLRPLLKAMMVASAALAAYHAEQAADSRLTPPDPADKVTP